ncbi:hypothetical protein WMY93_002931 [Mugilogobius chulae]|uniref:C2H2-type domain-containing protein n=1 Tax=Mugilogobius chulae TaxID=88201 RepID=A0AAW0Q3I4_9GOBI
MRKGGNGDASVEKEDKEEEAEDMSDKEGEEKAKEQKMADSAEEGKKKELEAKEDGVEGSKDQEAEGEAQFVIKDLVYYLCPGDNCDKVFYKIGHTMTKHAIKYHLSEELVQERVFKWARQKCILCLRHFTLLPHFKEHMKLHLEHPRYFCYHQSCGQRFASSQELRNHETKHTPLRPQCMYTACENVFNSMFELNDHEWRHFIPTPLKSDSESGSSKQKRHSEEAPWKQRVKVEELWLQNKSASKDETSLRSLNTGELNDSKYDNELEKHNDDAKTVNENATIASACESTATDLPLIEQYRTFKPNDPAFKPLFKASLVRPPPSMYMKESELSMRKRKIDETEAPPVKNPPWNQRKKEYVFVDIPKPKPEPETPKIRHRCEKCLSFFGSLEELQKHKSLNNCSALFGFDSDDES